MNTVFFVPTHARYWRRPAFTVQVAVGDPASGTLRLSNVESMVCIP
jgi:hypothetical protein